MADGAPRDDAERLAWVRLARTERVGAVVFRQLVDRFGSASGALDALPGLAGRFPGGRPPRIPPLSRVRDERAALAAMGGRFILLGDDDYPAPLSAITDPPPVLSSIGSLSLAGRPVVAVVGARNASASGRRIARDMARSLGEAGVVVASGLARGIDAAAHDGALATGTAAVVAGGVDVVYPRENRALHEAIAADGLLLSEMPLGTVPTARHFPRRNRIVSGLAYAVVVVEAALRSGSLITARLAGEQGREVMAIPGSPLDPRCHGANALIKSGATLVEDARDVLEALAPMLAKPLPRSRPQPAKEPPTERPARASPAPTAADDADTETADRLLALLGATPVAVDELIRECQLSPATVRALLLEAELAGRVERHPGDRFTIIFE